MALCYMLTFKITAVVKLNYNGFANSHPHYVERSIGLRIQIFFITFYLPGLEW
jgi:hypothetical protein